MSAVEKIVEPAIEVSILMPCLNEAETLRFCVEEAQTALRDAGVRGEVLIADNGSIDGSAEIARKAGARVIHVEHKGYGNALLGGIEGARGTYVLMGDADGSYDFRELKKFLGELRSGADLVMGCRLPKGGGKIEPGAMPWKHRWIGNPVLSALGRFFFSAPVDDFHCGLRAFRKDAVRDLKLSCTGMEFASEMVVKAVRDRLDIRQVPITLRPDKRSRPPHLRSWRDGWRHLRFMLLFTPKWLFLIPGGALTVLGGAGFLVLMQHPVTVHGVTFDTNTLLVCAMAVLVGVQIIAFSVFVKAFAVREGLLRPDPRVSRLLSANPVEWGVTLGVVFMGIGLGYLVFAIIYWRETGFGNLPYEQSLRIVIPAVTAIALGAQALFSGFVLGVLGLEHRSGRVLDNETKPS